VSPILVIPPEPTGSHDFNGLLFIEFALTLHFSVSSFAHDFTFFFSSLSFLVIAFLLLPLAIFFSAISLIMATLLKRIGPFYLKVLRISAKILDHRRLRTRPISSGGARQLSILCGLEHISGCLGHKIAFVSAHTHG